MPAPSGAECASFKTFKTPKTPWTGQQHWDGTAQEARWPPSPFGAKWALLCGAGMIGFCLCLLKPSRSHRQGDWEAALPITPKHSLSWFTRTPNEPDRRIVY